MNSSSLTDTIALLYPMWGIDIAKRVVAAADNSCIDLFMQRNTVPPRSIVDEMAVGMHCGQFGGIGESFIVCADTNDVRILGDAVYTGSLRVWAYCWTCMVIGACSSHESPANVTSAHLTDFMRRLKVAFAI